MTAHLLLAFVYCILPYIQSDSYRSYLVHEDLVVTERIDDVKPLGFYIRRLCDGKDTYRMERRANLPGTKTICFTRCYLHTVDKRKNTSDFY